MSEHRAWAQRAYEPSRQQQAGRADAAPAWDDLPRGAQDAITAAAIFTWGQGHQEGLETAQRQAGRRA